MARKKVNRRTTALSRDFSKIPHRMVVSNAPAHQSELGDIVCLALIDVSITQRHYAAKRVAQAKCSPLGELHVFDRRQLNARRADQLMSSGVPAYHLPRAAKSPDQAIFVHLTTPNP